MEKAFQEGKRFYACGTPIVVAENEKGETHVYRASDRAQLSSGDLKAGAVFGGTKGDVCENTSVIMESGFLTRLYGGSDKGTVRGNISLRMEGGMIAATLYGAGVADIVEGDIEMAVAGGAVKKSLAGGGEALECHGIRMDLPHVIATSLYTGTLAGAGVQTGDTTLLMDGGVTLTLHLGGTGLTDGNIYATVSGGYIEKKVDLHRVTGKCDLHFYKNLPQKGSGEAVYPMIPEGLVVDWFENDTVNTFKQYREVDDGFYEKDEDGKLTVRFLEIRDPERPKYSARFPEFIGDCILVHFPSGEYMLIDTGLRYAEEEVVGTLKRLGIEKLDYLQGTHYHHDHMGNVPAIMDNFEVGTLILPKIKVTKMDMLYAMTYIAALEAAEKHGVPIMRVSMGDGFDIGETRVDFLSPLEPWMETADLNRESVATRITFRENSAMFGGDISDPVEEAIADKYGDALRCDLLKLSHHAIIYQGHYKYLDACSPRYCVAQNHREDGVFMSATRYQLNHVHHIPDDRIFVTGIHGRLKFTFDGTKDGVTYTTQYEE